MFSPPEHALSADLVWWRGAHGMRTVVTLLWSSVQPFHDSVYLHAYLFDGDAREVADWRIPLAAGLPVFIDSAADGPWHRAANCDGVLALYACTKGPASSEARTRYNRLFPIVDWRRPDGRVATLHSDQVIRRARRTGQQFTEIVVLETAEETNALVVLSGEEEQPANGLEIVITNSAGQSMTRAYERTMAPFTAHRIELISLFPDIVGFAACEALQVSGSFRSCGLYTRPYVETTGVRWGIYHAGDVYDWSRLPHFAHAHVCGEVNPVAVRSDATTRTLVNLLHSHGDFEDEVCISAALFDESGACVANRPAWRLLPRNGLCRFDVADLIPDPAQDFRGHLALGFSAEKGVDVPRHQQALLEVRRADSVARTMAWSDEWNSVPRLARRDRRPGAPPLRSYFRVWVDDETFTEISVTNAGHRGYAREANLRLCLLAATGESQECFLSLPAFATRLADVEEFFPDVLGFLAPSGLGLLIVESASDLANLAYTCSRRTGALAMEHFMAEARQHEGRIEWPPGS